MNAWLSLSIWSGGIVLEKQKIHDHSSQVFSERAGFGFLLSWGLSLALACYESTMPLSYSPQTSPLFMACVCVVSPCVCVAHVCTYVPYVGADRHAYVCL